MILLRVGASGFVAHIVPLTGTTGMCIFNILAKVTVYDPVARTNLLPFNTVFLS